MQRAGCVTKYPFDINSISSKWETLVPGSLLGGEVKPTSRWDACGTVQGEEAQEVHSSAVLCSATDTKWSPAS